MLVDKLYCGNSLELIDGLDLAPKLIILHPPDIGETNYTLDEYREFLKNIYLKCSEKLDPSGTLVSINTDRKMSGTIYTKHIDIKNIMSSYTLFDYKCWIKTLKANLYVPTIAHILFYRKGKNTKNITPEYRPDAWLFEKDKIKKYPTKDSFPAKMIDLITKTFTNPGDLVFDPFVGSGTTCISAKKLDRKYIGFDISPEYLEIAQEQLDLPASV